MKRFLMAVTAVVLGLFTLLFSLVMAIPLAIVALITGKKMQRDLNRHREDTSQDKVIDGEYEDITDKKK